MRRDFYYIANIRMPTERAHGIQIMEMCQSFADNGYEIQLVVPNRRTPIREDPFIFYGIRQNFKIKKLWCLDLVKFGKIGHRIELATFLIGVFLRHLNKSGIFYTRDELIAVVLKVIGKDVVYESHTSRTNVAVRMVIVLRIPFVVITASLKDFYMSLGVSPDTLLVAPDAADIDRFDISITQEESRKKLGLPLNKKIVLYKGSLIPWKGADTLAESIKYIKTENIQVVFIGGKEEDVENFKRSFGRDERILIQGNRPRTETPLYQKAADVLVIPNSAKEDISKLYTSPMKLFGYMAGGVPIVASDLPSIREILDEQNTYFFEPDSARSLGNALDTVFKNYAEAQDKARQSLEKVRAFSWKNRAKNILSFIGAKIP